MITCNGVSKLYGSKKNPIYALKNVSFSIEKGEFVVILGASGAGKSTLLNIIGGIDSVDQGNIFINGEDLSTKNETQLATYRANEVGFIFQFYNLIPTLTVYENVQLMKELKKEVMDARDILKKVGLENHYHKFPSQLSGGEQQRVSIARAICKNPSILLCDEPTGALDSETGAIVLQLLYDMCQKYQKTTIVVTHNASIASIANRVIKVKNGMIVENSTNHAPIAIKDVEW